MHIHGCAAMFFNIRVDVGEPDFDPRKILDTAGHCRKIGASNADIIVLVQHLHHQAHVDEHRIGVGVCRFFVHARPESLRLNTKFRQDGVFLHWLWRQGAVKVVHHRNGVLGEGFLNHTASLAANENARLAGRFHLPFPRMAIGPCVGK